MNPIKIGILSIGSGVGQSVIESLLISNVSFITYGLGNNPMAFGAYACAHQRLIPSYRDPNYIDVLIHLCRTEGIPLLIPGSDDEAHILSHHVDTFKTFGIEIIVSDEILLDVIRDKFCLANEFNGKDDIFVTSETLIQIRNRINNNENVFPLIAKPKNGFASKGVKVILNQDDLTNVTTDDVLQKCLIPSRSDLNHDQFMKLLNQRVLPQIAEYSYQIIFNQASKPVHKMVSCNALNNGVPIEIIPQFDEKLWEPLESVIEHLSELGAKGPINIQGRWTDHGFKAFEINARFTGITGLRAQLGFNEVLYCIETWLNQKPTALMEIHPGKIGLRQTTNRSISLSHSFASNVKRLHFHQSKQHIFLTGASGYLGYELLHELRDEYRITALIHNGDISKESFPDIQFITIDELDLVNFGCVDTVLHGAFIRPYREKHEDYKASLDLTQFLVDKTIHHQIPSFIFLSSASIDRFGITTPYTIAKYSAEKLIQVINSVHPHLNTHCIRLYTLYGYNPQIKPVDMISKMVLQAIRGESIYVVSNQIEQRNYVKDAAKQVHEFVQNSFKIDSGIHFAHNTVSISTLSLAQLIQKIALEKYGTSIEVIYNDSVHDFYNSSETSINLVSHLLELFEHLKIND